MVGHAALEATCGEAEKWNSELCRSKEVLQQAGALLPLLVSHSHTSLLSLPFSLTHTSILAAEQHRRARGSAASS